MISKLLFLASNFGITDLFDVLAVSAVLYFFFTIFRRSRALNLLLIILSLVAILLLARFLHFITLSWLISTWWQVWVIALLVIFQPDLRRAVGQLGQGRLFRVVFKGQERMVQEVVQAARQLLHRQLGALIVIERDDDLDSFVREGRGTIIDSELSSEMLVTIFSKKTPLHDGAVIVRGDRVVAAGCVLPLAKEEGARKDIGTRHLAALGMSEESDAVVVVVSEDERAIAVAVAGKITRHVEMETLNELLELYITRQKR